MGPMADDPYHSNNSPPLLLQSGRRHSRRSREDALRKIHSQIPLEEEAGPSLSREGFIYEKTPSDTDKRSSISSEDRTPPPVFSRVRQMVSHFDQLFKKEGSSSNAPTRTIANRKQSVFGMERGTKESSPEGQRSSFPVPQVQDKAILRRCNEPTRTGDSCLRWGIKGHCRYRTAHRDESGCCQDFRRHGFLIRRWEHRNYCCIEDTMPNYYPVMEELHPREERKSLSESNLCKKEGDSILLSRLDSGTSDLSLEGYSLPLKPWMTGRGSIPVNEPNRRRSMASSLYPMEFPSSESLEEGALRRSKSCECLSLSPSGEWKRSNSSDSAVIVEDEAKGTLRSQLSSLSLSPAATTTDSPSGNSSLESDTTSITTKDEPEKKVRLRRCSSPSQWPRKTTRTPSVVISDHTGSGVSFHVAYESDDFPLECLLRSTPSEVSLSEDNYSGSTASQQSPCSTVSNTESAEWSLSDFLAGNVLKRRLSDCSTCSYLTGSEDEVEVTLGKPPSPPIERKSSNWWKLKRVVQCAPIIQTNKRQRYPWVQLAGHQGNFRAGQKPGSIMKKLCPAEEKAFRTLERDFLQPFVPECMGTIEGSDGDKYLQLQDLLSDFTSPCVMDIKMGVRTYLEEELAKARHKPKLRKDMYEKMIQIDSKAPTEAENRAKAVTKPRYMVWRETISSTATLGFRIEGIRRGDGTSSKDFKTTRTRDQVITALGTFVEGYSEALGNYIERLKEIKETLENSVFFKTHELIGSSLLFVHNEEKSGIWLIDFAKTVPLPDSVKITHKVPWVEGTHEDGYLIGLENLIDIFVNLHKDLSSQDRTTTTQPDKTIPNLQQKESSSSPSLSNAKTGDDEDSLNTETAASDPLKPPHISSLEESPSLLKEDQPEKFNHTTPAAPPSVAKESTGTGEAATTFVQNKKNVAAVIEHKCPTPRSTDKRAN